MKRLVAILCLGMLALIASDVGAQTQTQLPTVTTRQLLWADYDADGISAFRDTAFLTNSDAPDTTEILDMRQVPYFAPGMTVQGTATALLKFLVNTQHLNGDSIYVAVDGAFSPAGPWIASDWLGYLAGASASPIMVGQILVDTDKNSGMLNEDVLGSFPFVRFRVRHDATGSGAWSGTRFFVSHPNPTPMMTPYRWQPLRWTVDGASGSLGTGEAGMIPSPTYVDTTSLYVGATLADSTTIADTTEAFDMSQAAVYNLGRGTAAAQGSIQLMVIGTATGANADSFLVYADVGLTKNGPWRLSTVPQVVVRDNQGATWAKLKFGTTTVTALENESALLWAPYVRFRVHMQSRDAATAGIRGARAYVGHYSPHPY